MTTLRVTSCADCPFSYDGVQCQANWHRQGRDEEDSPTAPILHVSTRFNSDRSACDPYASRPDWCPLSAGPVVVEVEQPAVPWGPYGRREFRCRVTASDEDAPAAAPPKETDQ